LRWEDVISGKTWRHWMEDWIGKHEQLIRKAEELNV